MANFYVNIDNSYSATSGNGTITNPFNISQFANYLTSGVSNDDTFNIKGYYSNLGAGTISFYLGRNSGIGLSASNVTLKAWDAILFGPWKVEADLVVIQTNFGPSGFNYFNNLVVRDFVFSNFKAYRNQNPPNEPWYFKNGIFRGTSYFNSVVSSSPIYIQGCTLAGGVTIDDNYGGFHPQSAGIFQIDDCVFYNAPLSDNYTKLITFNSCVFSGTSAYNLSALQTPTSAVIINDCTFNWVSLAILPNINEITSANKGNISFESFGIDYSFVKRKSNWVLFGTTSGAYNSKRRGPGCFNFTNKTFYVDLSSTSTSGTGTSDKPIGGIVFSANNGFYNDDQVKLRGSLVFCHGSNMLNFCGSSGISMDSWDVSTYGPWKIVFLGTGVQSYQGFYATNHLFLKNGILYFRDSTLGTASSLRVPAVLLENMFIQLATLNPSQIGPELLTNIDNKRLTMKGCTLVMDTSATWSLASTPSDNISLAARDCVFDIGSFCGPALSTSAILDNCVFDASITALYGSIFNGLRIKATNCQYNWIPPNWPDFTNIIKAKDMSFQSLTSGIHQITISGSNRW